MNKTYSITDLDGFCLQIRNNAAQTIGDNTEDLDQYITPQQIKQITESFSLGVDENDDIIIDEDGFDQIFENVVDSIYQSGLSKLASEDKINCAWDDENNCMVFWAKES